VGETAILVTSVRGNADFELAYRHLFSAWTALYRLAPQLARIDFERLQGWCPQGPLSVEGDSLGLSACVWAVSLARHQPSDVTVAGSACVAENGVLKPVNLMGKLEALRRDWPHVKTVVVATGQQVGDPCGFRIARCETLRDALLEFGFVLPVSPSIDELSGQIDEMKRFESDTHTHAEWQGRALDAARLGRILLSKPHARDDDRAQGVRALVLATGFATHSGRLDIADTFSRELDAVHDLDLALLPAQLKAELAVRKASMQVDTDPALAEEGIVVAERALVSAMGEVPRKETALAWIQLLGTRGRALTFQQRYQEAAALLERAVGVAKQFDKREAPRSLCYQATNLRLGGAPGAALELVRRAVISLQPFSEYLTYRTTAGFLELEQARCHLALGELNAAKEIFQRLATPLSDPTTNPSRGAARGLAFILRRQRDPAAGDYLLKLLQIIEEEPARRIVPRRAAAMAVAEALEDARAGLPVSVSAERLQRAWNIVYPEVTEFSAMTALAKTYAY
jgi:tetratricopeptide (TPR) repeat protein